MIVIKSTFNHLYLKHYQTLKKLKTQYQYSIKRLLQSIIFKNKLHYI